MTTKPIAMSVRIPAPATGQSERLSAGVAARQRRIRVVTMMPMSTSPIEASECIESGS